MTYMFTKKYMMIRSNGSTHGGFPIRNRGQDVPAGYQLVGYVDTREQMIDVSNKWQGFTA